MSEEQTSPSADDAAGVRDFRYALATKGSVKEFIQRMQAMREGDPPAGADGDEDREEPRPASAIRLLRDFALHRPIQQLIDSSADFDSRDALNVLATAATKRPVEEAVGLALGQWKAEGAGRTGSTPLSDVIIHDVACQRTALDVAEFLVLCRRVGTEQQVTGVQQLVGRTLRVFVGKSSGRTHLDKALLYLALREDCPEEATELLRLTLDAIDKDDSPQEVPDTDPAELYDLVGALHQLSPSERILGEWLRGELEHAKRVTRTVNVAVRLLTSRADGADTLAEDVGRQWPVPELATLCSQLAERSPDRYLAVRAHAASRTDMRDLAHIIIAWQQFETLAKGTKDLLADIVKGGVGTTGPREPHEIDDLDEWLNSRGAPRECNRLLRNAAALHIDDRSGADLATLLHKIEKARDRNRVAQTIGQQLATLVLTENATQDLFIDYVKELHARRMPEEVRRARKELADASGPDGTAKGKAALVAVIATHLYGEALKTGTPLKRKALQDDCWDLLERYLENEQRVKPEDVVTVVRQLRTSPLITQEQGRYRLLLRATVGRWSDTHRRNHAIEELRRKDFPDEAEEVNGSLR